MKKLAILAAAAALAVACGTEEKKKKNTLPTTCTSTQNGDTRCNGTDLVEFCDGATWQVQTTCTAPQICGDAFGTTKGCINPPGSCTHNGLTPFAGATGTINWMDTQVLGYSWGFASNRDPMAMASANDANLSWENWPGFPAMDMTHQGRTTPGNIPLSNANADYNTCGLCVYGNRGVAPNDKDFMADEGAFNITSITTTPGAPFEVTITGLKMTEATIDFQNLTSTKVPGGETWCIDNLTISTNNSRWPCFFFSDLSNGANPPQPVPGNAACFGGSTMANPASNPRIITCNMMGEAEFTMTCGTDCSDNGMGVATCM